MKELLTSIMLCLMTTIHAQQKNEKNTIYQFTVKDITGKDFSLSSLRGKKVMLVNTASKCGLTPQYEGLEKIYQKYKDQGFIVIGFPSNDFMGQKPAGNHEIAEFCKVNYGVTFPMMEKLSVKGRNAHPLYQFLTQKVLNGVQDSKVEWNFQKYLIGTHGKIEKIIPPRTKPDAQEIIDWIER